MYIRVFFLALLLTITPGCERSFVIRRKYCSQQVAQQIQPVITIWVHGTSFVYHPIHHPPFNGVAQLYNLSLLPTSTWLAQIGNALRGFYKPEEEVHIYLFAWNGKLNCKEREIAGLQLHNELTQLCLHYKKIYGSIPQVRIVTHSHGGNVVLNMTQVSSNHIYQIDELIMLACPVQNSTALYAQHGLFKNIYAISSGIDLVQVIAPQITYQVEKTGKMKSCICIPPLSGRYFTHSSSVKNIKLKINGRSIMHSEFHSDRVLKLLPHIIEASQECFPLDGKAYALLSIYSSGDSATPQMSKS